MNSKTLEAVTRHGETLKAIFNLPQADALKLCKQLRRIEVAQHRIAEQACNGEIWNDEAGDDEREEHEARVLARLDKILNFKAQGVPIFLNGDPRGYALKIKEEWMRVGNNGTRNGATRLDTDWGGYGLIAPDLTEGR